MLPRLKTYNNTHFFPNKSPFHIKLEKFMGKELSREFAETIKLHVPLIFFEVSPANRLSRLIEFMNKPLGKALLKFPDHGQDFLIASLNSHALLNYLKFGCLKDVEVKNLVQCAFDKHYKNFTSHTKHFAPMLYAIVGKVPAFLQKITLYLNRNFFDGTTVLGRFEELSHLMKDVHFRKILAEYPEVSRDLLVWSLGHDVNKIKSFKGFSETDSVINLCLKDVKPGDDEIIVTKQYTEVFHTFRPS